MENKNNNNKKAKILIAEDDLFLLNALNDKLTRENYEIIKAENGEAAMEKMAKTKPDLVLLDLMMPKKSGFEVLEEIKKDKKLQSIPVIVLTNLGQESDIKICRDMGVCDYLIKSNNSLKEIVKKINYFLRQKKL